MARVFSAPIIGQSAASGAQVIDGSLKFDNNYLTRTPGSEGNFMPGHGVLGKNLIECLEIFKISLKQKVMDQIMMRYILQVDRHSNMNYTEVLNKQ